MADSGPAGQAAEDNRVAYSTATAMLFHEHQVTWSRFNAMVVAHGILLAGISSVLMRRELFLLLVALCSVGVLLSAVWWLLITLSHDAFEYWYFTALEIEHGFEGRIRTLREASAFRRGVPVTRPLAGRVLRRAWLTRYVTTRRLAHFTVLVFAGIYLGILVYAVAWAPVRLS